MEAGRVCTLPRAVSDWTCADIPVSTSGELCNLSSHFHAHACPSIMGLFREQHTVHTVLPFGVDCVSGVFQKCRNQGEVSVKNILHLMCHLIMSRLSQLFCALLFFSCMCLFFNFLSVLNRNHSHHLSYWIVLNHESFVWLSAVCTKHVYYSRWSVIRINGNNSSYLNNLKAQTHERIKIHVFRQIYLNIFYIDQNKVIFIVCLVFSVTVLL